MTLARLPARCPPARPPACLPTSLPAARLPAHSPPYNQSSLVADQRPVQRDRKWCLGSRELLVCPAHSVRPRPMQHRPAAGLQLPWGHSHRPWYEPLMPPCSCPVAAVCLLKCSRKAACCKSELLRFPCRECMHADTVTYGGSPPTYTSSYDFVVQNAWQGADTNWYLRCYWMCGPEPDLRAGNSFLVVRICTAVLPAG